jgi:4-oxalocrotonate tautomerase
MAMGAFMLLLRLTMIEGRSDDQKRALAAQISAAAHRHLGEPLNRVRMIIHEVPDQNWSVAGITMRDRSQGPR